MRGLRKVARSNRNSSQQWKHFALTVSYVRGLRKVVLTDGNMSQQSIQTFVSDGKLCSRIGKGRAQQWKHFAVTGVYVWGLGVSLRRKGDSSGGGENIFGGWASA